MNITASTLAVTVDHVAASVAFFTGHLGYREVITADDFTVLVRDDAATDLLLLRRGTDGPTAGFVLAFTVTDIELEAARLHAERANITAPLRTEPWGDRVLELTDPNGIIVQLVEWLPPAGA